MVIFEQDTPNKRTNKHIPLSATLIASVLLALSPKEQVVAKAIEDNNYEIEIKNLSSKYHSLLNELNHEDDKQDTLDLESELDREFSIEEVKVIQEQLILFIEKETDIILTDEMKKEILTLDELEVLFGELLETPIIKDESDETEEMIQDLESLEVSEELESVEEELSEEFESVEEEVSEELESVEVEVSEELEPVEEEVSEELEPVEEEVSEELESVEVEVSEELELVEDEMSEEPESVEEELITDKEPAKVEVNQATSAQPATFTIKTTAEKSLSYTIRAGDTLNKIAREHNVTVSHIAKLNNISNVNLIRVGQVLTIHGNKIENVPADDLGNLGKPMTNNEFIEFLGRHASVAAKEQNLYASVMIAQAALESGFGTSGLSSSPNHNLYGMKGRYQGDSVVMRTREYSTAKGWHYVNAHFKKYPSYLESLLDHSAYIRRGTSWAPAFYSGVWRENTTSYRDATSWLQGRYATDPTYASKLNRIIESYNLTRFDAFSEDDSVARPPVNNTRPEQDVKPSTSDKEADNTPENTDLSNYRVKRGDTLSRIALVYKMSVRELKELNNLKSDLILVGQNLKVKESVVEIKPTPTPTPTPEKPSESDATSYTVKRGDTLSQIAPRYKMSVRELKELNNLTSDLILIGQNLKVKESVVEVKPTPAPTPTPEKPSESDATSYTVKRGDTLSQIAPRYKMSVRELKELNNLTSDLILIGQNLKVKESVVEVKPTPPPTPTPEKPNESDATSYTVKRGDTLSQIAPRYKMSVRELKELNNLTSDLILIGQNLKVKESVAESKPTPSSPNVSSPTSYLVESGDTLSHIARVYKMSVRELKELNNLTSDLIRVGQSLEVKKNVVTLPSTSTPSIPTPSNNDAYTVKSGDTLSHIARVYKMSVRELKELNNLRSDLILVGQQLKINQVEKVSNNPSVQSYQIKAGDTLSSLARKFNTTVGNLKVKNNLKSDLIFVNQRLTI